MPPCTPALVLSGGGARGAYQVGVLRHLARAHPDLRFRVITGVSAGAINATFLAGRTDDPVAAAEELSERWCSLTTGRVMRSDVLSLLGNVLRAASNLISGGSRIAPPVRGLVDTGPLRTFLAPLLDPGRVESRLAEGDLQALAISATSYLDGTSVTWVQASPETRMWSRVRREARPADITVDHVMASAAIPLFFPARRVGDEYFGDGSLRQAYPLSPAVNLGADRILAVGSRFVSDDLDPASGADRYPAIARVLGLLLNSIFLDNLDADAERLERINRLLERVDESKRWLVPQRHVELLVLRPSRDIGRMAARFESSLPAALRYMIRGLGTRRSADSDLLSYLVFEREYLRELIELGERDASLNRVRIARFAEGCLADA